MTYRKIFSKKNRNNSNYNCCQRKIILGKKEIANELNNLILNTKLPEQTASLNELKEKFHKSNKIPGIDDTSAKVIRLCFGELAAPLKHIFDLSLSQGIFPDKLKIVKVTPIYKNDENTDFKYGNYRPIAVLPCFSLRTSDVQSPL